jgi:hypothetical protein
MDSHLTGPIPGVSRRFWIYYGSRGDCTTAPFACLDVDDIRHGPETISLEAIVPGVYRYYVYDYDNRFSSTATTLGNSGARVQFYVGSTLRATFFVPSGTGNAWAVFEWDGTNLIALNNLYNVVDVPMPARLPTGTVAGTALSVEDELRQLISRLPAKPQPR